MQNLSGGRVGLALRPLYATPAFKRSSSQSPTSVLIKLINFILLSINTLLILFF